MVLFSYWRVIWLCCDDGAQNNLSYFRIVLCILCAWLFGLAFYVGIVTVPYWFSEPWYMSLQMLHSDKLVVNNIYLMSSIQINSHHWLDWSLPYLYNIAMIGLLTNLGLALLLPSFLYSWPSDKSLSIIFVRITL